MSEKDSPQNQQTGYEQPRDSEISLAEIFKIIRRRQYGIVAVIALFLVLSLLYYGLQTPEYHAVSVMMINDTEDPGDLLAKVIGPGTLSNNKTVKKDVELLQSMPIAELTVRELYRSGRRDSLEFFGKRPYYSPIASLVKSLFSLNMGRKPQLQGDADETFRRYALKLNGRIRVDVMRETNVLKVSVVSPFPDEAAFLTNTLCRVYKEADIVRNSEKYAQANRFIADMLREQQKKVAEADNLLSGYMEANEIYEFTGNTQQLLDKLIEADAKQNGIMAEYNIASNSLSFLNKKLSEADRSLGSRITKNVNTQLGSIQDEIRSLESAYIRLMQQKGPDNAEVVSKRKQLDVVKTRYEQLSRSKIAGEIRYAGQAQKYSFDMVAEKLQIERKLNELSFSSREFSRLKQYYETLLSTLPKKQQEFAKLQRDREVVSKTYLFLKEKLDETRILEGSEVGGVAIVGSAFRPFTPEKPSLQKNLLMGLVLGGLFAMAYAYGAELVDDTVKEESFFRDIGLTMLSVIPLVSTESKSAPVKGESRLNRILYNTNRAFREKLLAAGISREKRPGAQPVAEVPMPKITDNLTSAFAESFRMLRNALDYSRIENPLQSILISGTAMSEGKSTVCANLGMAYALIGKKTIIIDCDLRRASQHKKLNCKRAHGLTDYLFSQQHEINEDFFQPTHLDNLFVLSAGQKVPNPNELLGSPKMLELLAELRGRFDKVLIDCPPLFLSDAAQLARSVEGIVLASRLRHTSRRPLEDFVTDQYLRPQTLGVAVIASRDSERYGYGKYGYGKYGYGHYEDES
ncbi:MAG: polysaccharide biosynthesis tyrosine autokinase [Chlorobium sp.]|uniref:GumC family protein n=1 Tax=Chlorobium sp. TaxID=1095 RepID=UPI0025BE91FC|nr:polysaccharide biosynthesis tyrosine autokinase [Chlorobium sp.]MCF8384057.1 polysaccharide biosynthesis tyrosine autokinase [Chlorobium sp.]